MSLPPELWPEISRMLDEALNLAPEERLQWLNQLARDRPDLAHHVRRLLAAHDRPTALDPLKAPPWEILAAALAGQREPVNYELAAGLMLGPYRLIAAIGQGGMASVWLAEQTVNVLRRVALKIPHARLEDAAAATARFIHERDLLAALEHPGIARLYDANVSDDQRPYLAMEWIDGVPITQYADEQRLTVSQRVELFQQVLQAVRFAHTRLIIHRDIKPSNILVTRSGDVKLLDFGIAALMDDARGSSPTATGISQALTPESAAPEQLAGEPLSTSTDVYSLGVVLYELLAGRRPYQLTSQEPSGTSAALHEKLMTLEVTPLGAAHCDSDVSRARDTTPRQLRRTLAGDLEAICAKAMCKQASGRYDTAAAMSTDLGRWRARLPVEARRAGVAYRFGRFASRNRAAVISTGLVVLALCAGLGTALWQAERARQEARLARSVETFLSGLFDANDPEQAQGRDVSARELLARGAERLETQLQDQPLLLARLQHEVGGLYIQLGDNVAARPHLERSLSLYESHGQAGLEDAIDASYELVESLEEELQYDAARKAAAVTLARADRYFGPRYRWRLPVRTRLAWMLVDSHPQAAVDMVKSALDEAWKADPHVTKLMLKSRSVLANAYLELGQFEHARDVFASIITEAPSVPEYEHTDLLVDRYNLARARFNLREFARCERELAELVAAMDKHIGAGHDRTIKTRALWSQSLAEMGNYRRAIEVQKENVGHTESRSSVDSEVVSLQKLTLAKLMKIAFQPRAGLPLAREGLAFFDAKYPDPFWTREVARRLYGELLLEDGQLDAGIGAIDAAIANASRLDDYAVNSAYADLLQAGAMGLRLRGRPDDTDRAMRQLEQACKIYADALGAINQAALRCSTQLGWLRALRSPADPALVRTFRDTARLFESTLPANHAARAELLLMDSELAVRMGETARASEELRSGQIAWSSAMGPDIRPTFLALH